jgi:cytochrome c-type biogenesis protein CcmF
LLAAWVIATVVYNLARRIRRAREGGTPPFATLSRSYWGMQLAHTGIAVFIIGVTLVKGFEVERDLRMDIGETTNVAGYEFRFDGTTTVAGPNYQATRGYLQVMRDGRDVTVMRPEKRIYGEQGQPMTETAIDTGLFRDLYVSLGEPVGGTAWAVRIYYKPFVKWIWGGCLLMALGGLLALSDRRYRIGVRMREIQETVDGTTDAAARPVPAALAEGRN